MVSRELAFLLATGQSKTTLLKLVEQFDGQSDFEEVLVCWVQELVVRGNDLYGEKPVARMWRQLRESAHPLAALPLRLERIETELRDWLPNVRVGGSSCGLPYGPSETMNAEAPGQIEPVAAVEIAATADIASVVANWQEESNGRCEAKRFRLDRATMPSTVNAGFMKTLPLLCLEGATVEHVVVRAVPTEHALGVLFSASAIGGAYNHGRRSAYGRLELWRSVAALTRSDSTDISCIAENAANWNWYSFDARSDWFEQVAWDLGIVAMSPDATEMAVLAATDTD